jgi:hypothetical protein
MIALRRQAEGAAATLLFMLLMLAPVMTAPAPNSTPQAFLDAIYKTYLGKESKGIAISRAAVIRQYFVPALAAAMIKDQAQAARRSEVPALDGDPFVDAQDWDIANLAISVKMEGAAKAVGTVTFTNFGEAHTVRLDLVKSTAGWRIADIKMAKRSLRELYPAR